MKKNILNILLAGTLVLVSCQTDLSDIESKLSDLDRKVNKIKKEKDDQILNLQKLIALEKDKTYIKSYKTIAEGYKFELSDGTTLELRNGEKGESGAKGKNGLNGKDGKNGLNGKDGKNGLNGKDGKNGLNGKDGKNGLKGKDGKNGLNGKDGENGANGINGRNGKNGVDGVNGKNGVDGRDGVNGKDGENIGVKVEEKGEFIFITYNGNVFKVKKGAPSSSEHNELISFWKDNGVDVAKWIGKVGVSVKVTTGKFGSAPFENSEVKNYTGIIDITISENATKQKPLLKMTKNAFGLNDYLQWVFRNETILNKAAWYNPDPNDPISQWMPPAPKAVIEALGVEKVTKWKNKEYPFNVVVDNIEVKADGSLVFLRNEGGWSNFTNFLLPINERDQSNKLAVVDFQYEFPLWDELVKLSAKDSELKKHIQQGGSIHPNNYISANSALVDYEDWGEFVKPKATYDDKEMKFQFNSDHKLSGAYDVIQVTLTAK